MPVWGCKNEEAIADVEADVAGADCSAVRAGDEDEVAGSYVGEPRHRLPAVNLIPGRAGESDAGVGVSLLDEAGAVALVGWVAGVGVGAVAAVGVRRAELAKGP